MLNKVQTNVLLAVTILTLMATLLAASFAMPAVANDQAAQPIAIASNYNGGG